MIVVPNDNLIRLYGPSMVNIESEPVQGNDYDCIADLHRYMGEMMMKRSVDSLSAPKVGIFKRIVVVNDAVHSPQIYLNPEIVGMYGKELPIPEHCISFPPRENECLVPRMQTIILEYEKPERPKHRVATELHGMQAAMMQHEIDHLDGAFFFGRAAPQAQQRLMIEAFNVWKKENIAHVKSNPRPQPAHR